MHTFWSDLLVVVKKKGRQKVRCLFSQAMAACPQRHELKTSEANFNSPFSVRSPPDQRTVRCKYFGAIEWHSIVRLFSMVPVVISGANPELSIDQKRGSGRFQKVPGITRHFHHLIFAYSFWGRCCKQNVRHAIGMGYHKVLSGNDIL